MSGDHIQDRQAYEIVGSSGLGAGLFLAFAPIHLMVAESVSVAIAAVTLALIWGAYVGFGAASDSRIAFSLELAAAALYGLTALLGLLWHRMALPAGLAAHALWGPGAPQWPFRRAGTAMVYPFLCRDRSAGGGLSVRPLPDMRH